MDRLASAEKNESIIIAQGKTIEDWLRESRTLEGDTSRERWKEIFEEYFVARLETRYLEPIRIIDKMNLWQGEGFSIVAIQCSLIEFIQSTVKGENYVRKKKKDLAKNEYNDSGRVFKEFLTENGPFSSVFNHDLAKDFYENVRCAVLHEACTKGKWVIHAASLCDRPCLIDTSDPDRRILYRNDFTATLEQFITTYGERLQTDPAYQAAFKRKFDALAKP